MREHWREVDYWLWVWHKRVRPEAKLAFGAVLLLVLLGGGWFAADRLTAAHASGSASDAFVLETTVEKIITVRERGKVVRKVVPIVKRVYLPRQTAVALQTKYEKQLVTAPGSVVTAPGSVRVVRRLVTTYVPVVKTQLVRVNGKTHTVVRTQLVPTTRVETQIQVQTQTQTRVSTNQQTIVNQQTITNTNNRTITQTQTLPAQTVTVTGPTQTVTGPTQTVTGPTQTVTGPTQTETVTETVTVTETKTVTETVPPGGR